MTHSLMVEFPTSVTQEIVVLAGKCLPPCQKVENGNSSRQLWGKFLGTVGRQAHVGVGVHIFKRFELL